MASRAVLGWGTLFQTESLNSPNTWVTVAEVSNISPPASSRDVLDLSTGNAPNEWRTSIPGMPSPGEVVIDFNFIVTGNSPNEFDYYSDLKLEMDDQTIRRRRIVFPNGAAVEFDAYLTDLSSEIPVGAQIKATAKFTVTGEVDPIA